MSQQYLSEIRVFGFGFPPKGWALCNGQLLAIAQNQALFSLIGTTYGGNGTTNFQLPNFQSSTIVGTGPSPISGATYVLGEIGGVENVTLLTPNMAAHNHMIAAQTALATVPLIAAPPAEILAQPVAGTDTIQGFINTNSNLTPLSPTTIGATGQTTPHANMPPFLTLNVCISLTGIFPSRN